MIWSCGMFDLRMKRPKFCQSFVFSVTFLKTLRGGCMWTGKWLFTTVSICWSLYLSWRGPKCFLGIFNSNILVSFQAVCLCEKMSFLKFGHGRYITDVMEVLSSPELAEWQEAMPLQPWWVACYQSCGTCSTLGQTTRITSHGPQGTLYGTCGMKSIGAARNLKSKVLAEIYMTESCPLCTPPEWGCAALLGEPASSGVLWNPWLQGQDTSILQSGRRRVLGTLRLWHWSSFTGRNSSEKTAEQHP